MFNVNVFGSVPAVENLDDETAASYGGGYSGGKKRNYKSKVMLFEHELFHGKSLRLNTSIPNLKKFDGITSSLAVFQGRWALFEEPNYKGRYVIVGPGQYPILPVMEDQISSLKRVG